MIPMLSAAVSQLHIPHVGGDAIGRDAVHHPVQGRGGIQVPRPAQRVHAPESME